MAHAQGIESTGGVVNSSAHNKVRYVTWPAMVYILGYSLPIQDMNGIDTSVDGLLASGIIAMPGVVLGLLLAAATNIVRKAPSKTWAPNFRTKRGATLVTALLAVALAKAATPDGMLAMVPAFFAIGLIAGKWWKVLPGDVGAGVSAPQ